MLLSAMLAVLADWLAEPVTAARATRAINNAAMSLWSSLLKADVTTYADSPPTDLDPVTDLSTALPYSTPACIEFVQYYAMSLLSSPIYEQQQAEQWAARAEAKRQAAVDEVLTLQRRYLGTYPVPSDMANMSALLLRWTKEDPGLDTRYDAINNAIRALWQALIQADITTYGASVPAVLSSSSDVIPFTETAALEFIHYYALSLCYDALGNAAQAQSFVGRAEAKKKDAVEEIAQLARTFTAYEELTTLGAMSTAILRWTKRDPGKALRYDAVNAALKALWVAFIDADITTYGASAPDALTSDVDAIPFTTSACLQFLHFFSLSQCFQAIGDGENTKAWSDRAEAAKTQAVEEVLQLQRAALSPYAAATTYATMAALLLRWSRQDPGIDQRYDSINNAVHALWTALAEAGVTEYYDSRPTDMTTPTDTIPFQSLASLEFIQYYALSLCFHILEKPDLAKSWNDRAETKKGQAVQEVLTTTRSFTGSYPVPTTMEYMGTLLLRWTQVDPGLDIRYDGINNAIRTLWQGLIAADVTTYAGSVPATLADPSDNIPFTETAALQFIHYYALSLCLEALKRGDQAKSFSDRAEQKRLAAIEEIQQLKRTPLGTYAAPDTLGGMSTLILRWLKTDPGQDVRYDAINNAIRTLWAALIDADIGTYGSDPPDYLTSTLDAIPLSTNKSAQEFIEYYALSLCSRAIGKPDDAKTWFELAETKRAAVVEEELQKHRIAEAEAPVNSLAAMRGSLRRWIRKDIGTNQFNDAINDAVESLWESLVLVAISNFVSGPASVTFAAASERTTITSIADPTAAPTATDTPGGALAGRSYSITYTIVTESGSETLESPALAYSPGANNLATVASPAYVEGAYGWNVYVGTVTGRRALQNSVPVSFGSSWTEPTTGIVDEPGAPSPPVANTTGDDIFYIRSLELALSGGGYRRWEQADIASELMRRAARAISGTDEYQIYYWDLLNQRTIELRPAAGIAAIPRYFYVRKPRRMRFDNAILPFGNLPVQAFLQHYALSHLFLAPPADMKAAQIWATSAEEERKRCQQVVLMQSRNKNQRITPYMV